MARAVVIAARIARVVMAYRGEVSMEWMGWDA